MVVDAGANIGMFTIRAARKVGDSGVVIAVEPQPDNITFLRENIRLNELTNVKIIIRALYFEDNTTVSFQGNGVGGHLSATGVNTVKTISLKKIISEFTNRDIWLKMDIEGAEEFIFAKDQDISYLKGIRGIAYEIHSRSGLEILNTQLSKLNLPPSPVYYEHDFLRKLLKESIKHPVLIITLYREFLPKLALRVLKGNPTMESSDHFEPGMQYAWRD